MRLIEGIVSKSNRMRSIALEEHFASPRFLKIGAAALKLFERLCDVGEKRTAEMNVARIDVQVLALSSPGTEQLEGDDAMALAGESNDFLFDAAKKNPDRLVLFLPPG